MQLSPCPTNYLAHVLQLLKPVHLQPVVYSKSSRTRSPYTTTKYPHLLQLDKARVQQ